MNLKKFSAVIYSKIISICSLVQQLSDIYIDDLLDQLQPCLKKCEGREQDPGKVEKKVG